MNTAVTLLIPPLLTLVLAFALHILAGERAQRVGLVPVALSVLIGWIFLVRPGWVPVDDVSRILHIAVGASLLGLALDIFKPHRLITALLSAVFVLGSAYATVTGGLSPSVHLSLREGAVVAGLTVVAFLSLARLDTMRARSLSLMVLLTVLASGLAALSAIVGDDAVQGLAIGLAAALAGYFIFVAVTGSAVTDGLVLFAGMPILGMVWALAQRQPDLRLALLCVPLVLFAETTALRVPLPAARISALLYPLILAVLVSLPLVLAGLIAFVTTIP